MIETTTAVGSVMKAMALYLNELLEREGVDIREFRVQYTPKSKDSEEGIEWVFLRDEADGELYVDFTENGASVIEHKLEDLGNLWPEAARKVFLKYEPQLALLRQLLNTQNQVLKLTKKTAKKVAYNIVNS
jgi:hypothetical protein